jgi:hypothetical protein
VTTDTTTDKWLGDGNPFNERFPSCGLTERQVATLVGFSGTRVAGLGPSPAICKLSESGIVEISVRWAKALDDFGSAGKLWLKEDGTFIAAAVWEGVVSDARGPIRVYRWDPDSKRRLGDKADELHYERADSSIGAYEQTRTFIKHNYVNMEDTP